MTAASCDTITILRAHGRRLAKLIEPDETIVGYDSARTFDLTEQPVADLAALRALLDRLLRQPDRCVVRGAIADPARTSGVRRLVHPDPQTGEVPTLIDVPRQWCALDIDGLDLPASVTGTDIFDCGIEAVMHLPQPFRGAAFIVQASASHGIKPGVRLRLWFWLSRPTGGTELRYWLRHTVADPSIFRAAQVIYTAAPVFADGRADHLPRRIAEVPGVDQVAVPPPEALQPPPRPPAKELPQQGDSRAASYGFAALRNSTMRIRCAQHPHRHDTIIRETCSLARLARAGLLPAGDIRRAVAEAAAHAGKPNDETDLAITWALANPSTSPLPEGLHNGR